MTEQSPADIKPGRLGNPEIEANFSDMQRIQSFTASCNCFSAGRIRANASRSWAGGDCIHDSEDQTDGLSNFLDEKGMASISELVGKAISSVTDWRYLNLNHIEKASINRDLCISCGRCHIVCEDASHQAITSMVNGSRRFEVIDE